MTCSKSPATEKSQASDHPAPLVCLVRLLARHAARADFAADTRAQEGEWHHD